MTDTLRWREQLRSRLPEIVLNQIPRSIREDVEVAIVCDASMLVTRARVRHKTTKQVWDTPLDEAELAGVLVPYKLPGEFVALLCVSI